MKHEEIKFIKKSEIVNVIQWTGDNWEEIKRFCNIQKEDEERSYTTLTNINCGDIGDYILINYFDKTKIKRISEEEFKNKYIKIELPGFEGNLKVG